VAAKKKSVKKLVSGGFDITPAQKKTKEVSTLMSVKVGVSLDVNGKYPIGILFETKEERVVNAEIERLDGTVMIDKWQTLKADVDVKCRPLTKPIIASQLWALEFKRVIKTDAEVVHALYRGINAV